MNHRLAIDQNEKIARTHVASNSKEVRGDDFVFRDDRRR